jgi:hypothetical protein
MKYDSWLLDLRELRQEDDSPLELHNGTWKVRNRIALWDELSARIFDNQLEQIKKFAVSVLTECDPQFELPADERFAASIHGKNLKYSRKLRHGIAETLALLGSRGDKLKNCSQHKAEITASLAVREILDTTDWKIWASLNDLLPILSEASPHEFLAAVEKSLNASTCPFDSIFEQEGNGITGRIYISGLLWALEGLAWSEEYLTRVAVILADLATHDPGGNWSNRPANSLITILLPWLPQTLASVEKRISALKAIRLDFQDIAWKTVLSLLPNQHQTSSGSHKPKYRDIFPDDWENKVSHQEYLDQVTAYAEIAVEMAIEDINKLKELVSNLDNLPGPSFDAVLQHIQSGNLDGLSENEKLPIWTNLTDFISKHRRFSDASWALDEEHVKKIEEVANLIAPETAEGIYRKLFSSRDFDLYEEKGNWQEQANKLEIKRQNAVKVILGVSGIDGVLKFLELIEAPNHAGYALGKVSNSEIDAYLLPNYLDTSGSKEKQFITSYVWGRYQEQGWEWVNNLEHTNWTLEHICQLLVCLPFEEKTWVYAKKWLGKKENWYWKKVSVNPCQSESDLHTAMKKLLSVSRPQPVIDCLYYQLHEKQPLDANIVVKALLDVVATKEKGSLDSYHIIELIKWLQDKPDTSGDDLFSVEWTFLQLLDRHSGAEPKYLHKKLSSDSHFFCEVIRLIYRSKNEEKQEGNIDEKKKSIATNAWHLLHDWRRPPGLLDDGNFSEGSFSKWLEQVKEECNRTGHYEVAMIKVGEVLLYTPEDADGLWINQVVAKTLNDRTADDMRRGFRTEVFNSRGVHWVDPTGKPEKELAEQWNRKADAIEAAGFARFASTLKELAESYNREAEQVALRHQVTDDQD